MRVISGSAKGRKLAEFKGGSIRPTADRVREAIFSSLHSRLGNFSDCKVLDLFAGTGAMAIEALSRGAASAILVDKSREAEQLIKRNLATTHLENKARFRKCDIMRSLSSLATDGPFDLIFIDPPYAETDIDKILVDLIHFKLVGTDGIISVETSGKNEPQDIVDTLSCFDRRKYGTSMISYYSLRPLEND